MQPSGREDAFDEGPASEPVVPQRDGPNHLHLSPPQQPFSSLAYAPYSPPPSASTSLPSFYQPNPLYSFPPLPDRRASYHSSGSPFLPSPPQTVGQLVQSMVSSTHQRRSSLPSSSGSFNSPENSVRRSPFVSCDSQNSLPRRGLSPRLELRVPCPSSSSSVRSYRRAIRTA